MKRKRLQKVVKMVKFHLKLVSLINKLTICHKKGEFNG